MLQPRENALKEYGSFMETSGLSGVTLKRYSNDVKVFLEFLGGREVTPEILEEFKAESLIKYNKVTVRTMISGINKYLEFIGCKHRIKPSDLPKHNATPDSQKLTMAEYLLMLNALKDRGDDRMYMMVETLCNTDLKYGELEYLTVEAVDEGVVRLERSTATETTIYLPRSLREDLRKYCGNNGIYRGSVFLTKKGNLPDANNMKKSIRSTCRNIDVDPKKLTMQSFRAFYLKNLENMRGEVADLIDEDWRALHSPGFVRSSESSTDSYAQKWFNDKGNGLLPATKEKYQKIYDKYISPLLGEIDCRRITPKHIEPLLADAKKIPLRDRVRIMRVLQLVLGCAKKSGVKIRVNLSGLTTVKRRGGSIRILADDETDRMSECLRATDDLSCAGIYLCMNTGIRVEELCDLRREDLDNGVLKLPDRTIVLPRFLVEHLLRVYGGIPPKGYLLSGNARRFTDPNEMENRLRKIVSECGLENIDFTALRHTFGARCAENNMEPRTLAQIMGAADDEPPEELYYTNAGAAVSPLEFMRETDYERSIDKSAQI